MTCSAYYDRCGRPITKARFLLLCQDRGYGQIGHTQVTRPDDPGYLITTIWTGTGAPSDPTAVFETMVTRHGGTEPYRERYTNPLDARTGHNFFVLDLARKLFAAGHRGFVVIEHPQPVSLIKEDT